MSQQCLIIGAGISGLMAGTVLVERGWDVTLLDKGRGVGGRAATRRFDGATFDHGAQYFTVRDDEFMARVAAWITAGAVVEWARGFPSDNEAQSSGQYPRYCGADGMTRLAKTLAAALTVHVSTEVHTLNIGEQGWDIMAVDHRTEQQTAYHAPYLIITPPAEQTLRLLQSGNVAMASSVLDALRSIEFNPCFAVMARLDRPSAIPEPGGMFMPGEPISWIADNQKKGISAEPSITIHAGPEFTRAHYEDDRDQVARLLLDAAADLIGGAQVTAYQVQRWRYSQPVVLYPEKTLFTDDPAPVAFAGDAFDGAKIEGAALSGVAAANALINYANSK